MENYCTCDNLDCKMHPANHNLGCTPCIRANLKTKDIPKCFFNLVEGADRRESDTFAEFAKMVLRGEAKKQP